MLRMNIFVQNNAKFGAIVDRNRKFFVRNGFNILVDATVKHMNDASGVSGEIWIMGNHNNGITFTVDTAEFFHDDMGGTRIEIASRLIG